MSEFGDLIEESRELERRAGEIQGERELGLSDAEIDQIISDYHRWFARALEVLPPEYHDRFRDEFEGGTWTSKIKGRQQLEGAGGSTRDLELLERIFRKLPDYLEPFSLRDRGRDPAARLGSSYGPQAAMAGAKIIRRVS